MSTKQNITLEIGGMTCSSCAIHVKGALEKIDGVEQASVPSWSDGIANVQSSSEIPENILAKAIKEAGYSGKLKTRPHINKKRISPGDTDCDLIVIGTGGAGMGAAIKAAENGHTCAVIEAGTIGGTCVNVGCVPSKALLRAAEAYHVAGHHSFTGVHTNAEGVDWETVIAEKDRLVENLRQQKYIDVIAAYPQITFIQGRAKLQADGSVMVDGDPVYRGKKIVIATGVSPRILPLKGIESVNVLTSTSAMELKTLPHSMIIIGGRFIALEQAQIFSRFGTKITILQRSDRLIPDHEPEISEGIAKYFKEEGIDVYTGVKPTSIREDSGEKIVTAEVNGKIQEFCAEQILMAVGRIGNTEKLNLEAVGVEVNSSGMIVVDDTMQTSNTDIYAAGDVTDRPQLVYVAASAGGIAAENALDIGDRQLDLSVLPEVIFTDPQIATVGLTESQALNKGFEVKTAQIPLEDVPRALAARNTRGLIKLVADNKTDHLLGAHVLAAEGGEIIQTAAMAIQAGIKYGFTVQDMRQMLFPYLVQAEGMKLAALTFDKKVSQLSCCAA